MRRRSHLPSGMETFIEMVRAFHDRHQTRGHRGKQAGCIMKRCRQSIRTRNRQRLAVDARRLKR
jgi:hypothetical protein